MRAIAAFYASRCVRFGSRVVRDVARPAVEPEAVLASASPDHREIVQRRRTSCAAVRRSPSRRFFS